MTDLRQALAQEQSKYSDIVSDGGLDPRNKFDAQQEPVAWITRRTGDGGVVISGYETCEPTDYDAIPVYTAPPKREWVGLTREEVDAIREDIFKKYQMALSTSKDITSKNNYSAFNFYRAIEAKLKEKNT